jgi:DNA-binding transcriptional ArsR family regulator
VATYLPQPETDEIELRDVLRALGDDVRLQIVRVLSDGEYHPCRVEEFGIDLHKSTLSHHFKVLREAGVTMTEILGRNHQVRLRTEDLEKRFPGLLGPLTSALPRG